MDNFQFNTPVTVIFRSGSSRDPETYKNLIQAGRTLLVTDPTLQRFGVVDKVRIAMENAGADVLVYNEVEPEPNAATVRNVAEIAKGENVKQVVGLGGGSSMDIAKLAALMIPCPQPVELMYGVGKAKGKRLPLILIPTTAGTGSEGTHVAVVTGDDGEKSPIVGPQFICDLVILDAELTLTLPSGVTAATGIDAMVHSIEAYTSGFRKNPVSDQLAIKAFKLLFGNIRTAVMQEENIEARGNMLVGSMMAGLAFANATVGAIHALAYPLGTQFHLSHGESNSVVFAPVMQFNLPEAASLYANLSREILPECLDVDNMDAAERLIEEMDRLIPEIGLKDRLSDYGIEKKSLNTLADGALKQERILSYNIRTMDRKDILNVYKSVF